MDEDEPENAASSMVSVHPPSGAVLDSITVYLSKSIPVDIPQRVQSGAYSFTELHPEETTCFLCPSRPVLNSFLLITASGIH